MAKKTQHWERSYLWGRALKIEAIDAPGGLKRQVDRIRDAVGPTIGTRNTFANLFDRTDPPSQDRDPIEALRARLLVDAIGLDPAEWGVETVELPGAIDPERVLSLVGASDPGEPGGDSPESSESGATMRGLSHSVADLPVGDVYREKRAS
jgi:hypothetical protein